jgi:hypothetical protein
LTMDPRIGYGTKEYEDSLPDNEESVQTVTRQVYERLWWENIGQNISGMFENKDHDLKTFMKSVGKPVLVVASGPSVEKYKQLEILGKSEAYKQGKLTVVVCDRSLIDCLKNGIVPNLVVTIDATPATTKFFDVPDEYIEHLIPTAPCMIANPEAVKKARLLGPIYWWVSLWDDYRGKPIPVKTECPKCKTVFSVLAPNPKSYTRILYWMTEGKVIVQTLGNVGATAIFVALHLGEYPGVAERVVSFIGFDLGYPVGTPLEQDQYFKANTNLVERENSELTKYRTAARAAYEKEMKKYSRMLARLHKKHGMPISPEQDPQPPAMPPMPVDKTIYDCYRYVINPDTGQHVLVGLNWDVYRSIFLKFVKNMELNPLPEAKRTLINCSPESSVFGPGIVTQDFKKWLDSLVT